MINGGPNSKLSEVLQISVRNWGQNSGTTCLVGSESSGEVAVLIEVRCHLLVKLSGGNPHAEIAITLPRVRNSIISDFIVDDVSYLAGEIDEGQHRVVIGTVSPRYGTRKDVQVF